MRKIIASALITTFLSTSVQMPAYAQIDPMPFMPAPGTMVPLSLQYTPAYLKGIVIHPKDPFKLDFIIYKGDKPLTYAQKKEEYTKLTKYFLASLAIPDDDQWVNLSPYEKDRIIKDDFGKTEMGRDLLAQDYLLKQITASLIYPESQIGKEFWKKVYAQAQKQYGTTDIPVDTFNKVWVLPDDALIYEKGNMAYVLKNHLRVMLEEDYLALTKHQGEPGDMSPSRLPSKEAWNGKAPQRNHGIDTPSHSMASNIIRQIVLPELQKEVNEDKNFAPLRQVYSGMLLATWFKRTLKQSLLAQIYANKAKTKGIEYTPTVIPAPAPPLLLREQKLAGKVGVQGNDIEAIYQQYLKAYKRGVFNFIKEDTDRLTNGSMPRKYFSGGELDYAMASDYWGHDILGITEKEDIGKRAMLTAEQNLEIAGFAMVKANLAMRVEYRGMMRRQRTNLKNGAQYDLGAEFLKRALRVAPGETPDASMKGETGADENYEWMMPFFEEVRVAWMTILGRAKDPLSKNALQGLRRLIINEDHNYKAIVGNFKKFDRFLETHSSLPSIEILKKMYEQGLYAALNQIGASEEEIGQAMAENDSTKKSKNAAVRRKKDAAMSALKDNIMWHLAWVHQMAGDSAMTGEPLKLPSGRDINALKAVIIQSNPAAREALSLSKYVLSEKEEILFSIVRKMNKQELGAFIRPVIRRRDGISDIWDPVQAIQMTDEEVVDDFLRKLDQDKSLLLYVAKQPFVDLDLINRPLTRYRQELNSPQLDPGRKAALGAEVLKLERFQYALTRYKIFVYVVRLRLGERDMAMSGARPSGRKIDAAMGVAPIILFLSAFLAWLISGQIKDIVNSRLERRMLQAISGMAIREEIYKAQEHNDHNVHLAQDGQMAIFLKGENHAVYGAAFSDTTAGGLKRVYGIKGMQIQVEWEHGQYPVRAPAEDETIGRGHIIRFSFKRPEDVKAFIKIIESPILDLKADRAMNVYKRALDSKGGIDLNSANLNLHVKRDGSGVPLPLAQQDLAQLGNIQGLDPVILSITPACQTPSFTELVGHGY